MSVILGLNAKLFRGQAGATAATEVADVKDVTLNLETGEADVTTRGSKGWKLSAATLKEASVEFTILYDTSSGDFGAFQTAFFNGTAMALFISDGNGGGLDADFTITGFSVEQPLEEAVSVSVTAKPTMSTRNPVWKGSPATQGAN